MLLKATNGVFQNIRLWQNLMALTPAKRDGPGIEDPVVDFGIKDSCTLNFFVFVVPLW
jgi:hypothetical protein